MSYVYIWLGVKCVKRENERNSRFFVADLHFLDYLSQTGNEPFPETSTTILVFCFVFF